MRCDRCPKKLNLAQQMIKCSCEKNLCSKCRKVHDCTFDYRQRQQEKLEKQLVKSECQRIQKI